MQTSFESHENPLIRKLNSIFTITDDERQALLSLPMQLAVLKANQDIVREGDSPSRSCLLLSGFACTYKVTGEGKRQIMAFNIAGDVPDLQSLHLKVLDNSVGTITPCRVGFIPHEALHDICARHPRIAAAFWRETLIDAAIFREWMTSIGQREAYPRIAHLLCEMLVRLKAVGLAEDHSCDLPITQAEYGDALGLSTVHVNRVFQALRAHGLIETKGTQVNIPDWERLKQAGDFDPAYLHLEQAAA
ncbi:MAG TPA: Crp/Fnr family transcriptional regulator [Microvirga sp.]|jgi:CRP-like cAMP-binding protein|nr:Crp/Fnr family transcriptional regulator [Microvirga sp.]